MPAGLPGKVADPQGRVFTEASRDRANPARRLKSGLLAGTFQEPSERRAKTAFGCFSFAGVGEESRLPSGTTPDPQRHGLAGQQPASKPTGIELNLDLFESDRRDRVAMRCASAIEDRGWTGDEFRPDFGLV
jgi:hypothetical protein